MGLWDPQHFSRVRKQQLRKLVKASCFQLWRSLMVAALSGEYQDWIGASFGMCTYQKNASQVDAHAHLSFVATSLGAPW